MIQSARRSPRALLVLALAAELLVAGWWRWSWTTAPIETPFDYGSGHVAVVSENWRRAGALRQHFLPVMSTDRDLPEWPYRTSFAQEYSSVPPLAFMLHYGATRLLPRVEPVLLAKLLGQALACASVLTAAALLTAAFDAWAIFLGLSFLISGVPYLLWFANGYFAVNVGLAVQLVLVAWCANAAARSLDPTAALPVPGRAAIVVGGVLAFLGAFADYMPVAANGVACAGLAGLAISPRVGVSGRRFASRAAGAIAIGTAAAMLTTVTLYGQQMGLDRYRRALVQRVADRTGEAPFLQHFDVIRRQMLRAWPAGLLVALGLVAAVAVLWCAIDLVRRRSPAATRHAVVILFALAVGVIPSLGFHYRAVSYVSLHWWFSGTWTIGFAVALLAFVDLIRRTIRSRGVDLVCAASVVAIVAINVRFTAAQAVVDEAHAETVRMYRDVGAALPHDGLPLVVTDLTQEWPELFEDFPYATAYLRRPVLIREATGGIRLPKLYELYEGRPLDMGGEDAREKLVRASSDVYIAYDPDARGCHGTEIPLARRPDTMSVALCRAPARVLVENPSSVLGPPRPGYLCSAPPVAPSELHLVAKGGGTASIAWSPSQSKHVTYILEVGRAPGESNALVARLGRATTFTAHDVPAGSYFVRVRGRNSCGTGAPSNELTVVVQ